MSMPRTQISANHDVTRPSYLLKFSKPSIELWEAALPTIKEDSRQCIENLLSYHTPHTRAKFPCSQSAAVLVPLFIGRAGDLYVLLSRRSESLRQYAGDTALPGGKVEPQDLTAEDTARREAFEEIGLAQDRERVPLLCVMESFLAGNQMVVTPVVVLILDKTMQPNLNESEVTSIFSRPLASFLVSSFPDRASPDPSKPYHTTTDWKWNENSTIRIHRFLTGREADGVKPVSGLTAGILIYVAISGYGRGPDFEFQPPNAPTQAQQIAHAFLSRSNPLRLACEREGIDADKMADYILHPLRELNSELPMEERGKNSQDWRSQIEEGETCGNPNERTASPSSGIEDPIQRSINDKEAKGHEGTMRDEMQGRCLEARKDIGSDVTDDLNRRIELVVKEEQLAEQGELKSSNTGLSRNADQERDETNKYGSKL